MLYPQKNTSRQQTTRPRTSVLCTVYETLTKATRVSQSATHEDSPILHIGFGRDLLASICFTCGSARRILFRYRTAVSVCRGLPSKYTVARFSLSASSFSTSRKDESWLSEAQSSSILERCEIPWRCEIWLLDMSRTERFTLFSSPLSSVRALWDM
jgi:hypothetical protein